MTTWVSIESSRCLCVFVSLSLSLSFTPLHLMSCHGRNNIFATAEWLCCLLVAQERRNVATVGPDNPASIAINKVDPYDADR